MHDFNPAKEGYAAFRGYRTRFRIIGRNASRLPLLCIHGGPGLGCDYLEPIEEMLNTGRKVVFYEQLGCGASDVPANHPGWSLELSLEELRAVVEAAGLAHYHLLGHGWGGMVALSAALDRLPGISSIALYSTVASVPQWRAELRALIAGLPDEIAVPLLAHAQAGTLASDACACLVEAFRKRHLCRMNPWPECLDRSVTAARIRPEARVALLGASELEPAGCLAEWDVSSRLAEITVPALVVSGRYDLATPAAAAVLYRGIPDAAWVVFEHSAHVAHLEEPQRFLEVLDGFLSRVEGARRSA
jgi:proline-specific peptidase